MDANLKRWEANLSHDDDAGDDKVRVQHQYPERNTYRLTLQTERWFNDDTLFVKGAYRYSRVNTEELEDSYEYDNLDSMTLATFNNPHQIAGARSDNLLDQNVFLLNSAWFPTDNLRVNGAIRAEYREQDGNSWYPQLRNQPYDGLITRVEKSVTSRQSRRMSESLEVKYTGISKTTLYTGAEIQQERHWLNEDRESIGVDGAGSGGDTWERETEQNTFRGRWDIGYHTAPWNWLSLRQQFRYKHDDNDYDHNRKTLLGTSGYFDEVEIQSVSLMTHARVQPTGWFSFGFRHIVTDNDYMARIIDQQEVETGSVSNSYIFDVIWQPLDQVTLSTQFSRVTAATFVPEQGAGVAPTFNSDVNTWSSTLSYAPCEKVSFLVTLFYSEAENYEDFTATGLPLGAAFERIGLTLEADIRITDDVSLKPFYALSKYDANSLVEQGNYRAHTLGLEGTVAWG